MALLSGDTTMMQLCMPGEDAHAYMGAQCTGVTYEWLRENASGPEGKPKRQLGKVANLSLQYRTSAKTLVRVAAVQHRVKLTPDQALDIWWAYRRTYPGVKGYWTRQVDFARRNHYVETLAGRRVHLGAPHSWKFYKDFESEDPDAEDATWSHESAAINFPIQGVGADQKYLAMSVLRDNLSRFDARFAWELHDGLFVVVPDQWAEQARVEFKNLLSNLPYRQAWNLSKDLPIPFPVDSKVGPTWGQLKEVKDD